MRTRITRGSAPGTGISRAHSSGTMSKPRRRAATAGNSASRSSVSVKMQLTTRSGARSLRFMISRMSHSVAPTIASASLRSTVVAPRRAWSRSIALGCCQIALLTLGCGGGPSGGPAPAPPRPARAIALSGLPATVPRRFTCAGAGERPPLRWSGVPRGARELVLVVTDPDAPGGRFVHWTAFGISATAHSVPRTVRQGVATTGKVGWTPPCPPPGDKPHRYVFDLYALRAPSGLKAGAGADAVIAAVRGAVARGELVSRFGR